MKISRQPFEALFHISPFGLAILDAQGTILRANDYLAYFLQIQSTEQLKGQQLIQWLDSSHTAFLNQFNQLTTEKIAEFSEEFIFETSFQTRVGAQVRGVLIEWENHPAVLLQVQPGKHQHLQQTESEFQELQNQFDTVIELSSDAFIGIDQHQKVTSFSPGAEKIFGYHRVEVLGKSLNILIPSRFHSAHQTHIQHFATGPNTIRPMNERGLIVGLRKNGQEFPAEAAIQRLQTSGGVCLKIRLRDLSDRVFLENQLRQAQKMEAIGQLASGIAHDFNNLLTVISGCSEILLLRMRATDGLRPRVEEIRRSAERATSLIRQLNTFTQRRILETKSINLNSVINELNLMLQRLIGEDIELNRHLEPALDLIRADIGQIEQVIVNLVVNARDAMPRGGKISIRTANCLIQPGNEATDNPVPPGQYVHLSIQDSGCGMPKEVVDRIFDPFYTTKDPGKGTGLGLSTVYGIVKQYNGHITVDTQLNQGTTFHIFLHRTEHVTPQEVVKSIITEPSRGSETILLVEDEQSVRVMISETLQMYGYKVLEAANGQVAVEIQASYPHPIDLLISDLVMPVMDGNELARLLLKKRPTLKVMFMSGYTERYSNKLIGQTQNLSVDYLEKPFSLDQLLLRVRRVLDHSPLTTS